MISQTKRILLAHGSGGKLTHNLIEHLFVPGFSNEYLNALNDSAILSSGNTRIAFTTDTYVVDPLFFPGGDIGKLAVCGTVNDLAVCGAKPIALSTGFIIEEGFPIDQLERVVHSMQQTALQTGVKIVTGDTKVVPKGKADKLFINTSGVGIIRDGIDISPMNIETGDSILINGPIGSHGITIMAARNGLGLPQALTSDCAPLSSLVEKLLDSGIEIHAMRDPTRGGVATTLNEIANTAKKGIVIMEKEIPVEEAVLGACEIMGFDPLYIANEGKVLVFLPSKMVDKALNIMRSHPLGKEANCIGQVVEDPNHLVKIKTEVGGSRIIDMLMGEQLPRIC